MPWTRLAAWQHRCSCPTLYFPLGVIDPNTGHVQIIRIGYDASVTGGWDRGGNLLLRAVTAVSSLWRYRPER